MANTKLRPCDLGDYWSSVVTAMYLAEALTNYERENKRAPSDYVRLANAIIEATKKFKMKMAKDEADWHDASLMRRHLAGQLASIISDRRKRRISYGEYKIRTRALLRSRELSKSLYCEGALITDEWVEKAIAPDRLIIDEKWKPKRLAVDLLRKALNMPSPRALEGLRKIKLYGPHGLQIPVSAKETIEDLLICLAIPEEKIKAATKILFS